MAADGRVLTEMTQAQGEGFTIATVALADSAPLPRGAQPPSRVPPFAYVSSDIVLPLLVESIYRRGVQQAWGQHIATKDVGMRRWILLGAGALIGLVGGVLMRRRR